MSSKKKQPPRLEAVSKIRLLVSIALTLFIGACGGTLFVMLSLPLPWMLGSMFAVATAALLHAPVASIRKVRPPLVAVIGVTLGSTFSPDVMQQVAAWWPLTLTVIGTTVLMGATGALYLRRAAKLDPVTAFFSGMPGGVYEMTYQGGLMGGDERQIALVHSVRIFLVVSLVPIAFRWVYDLDTSDMAVMGHTSAGYSASDIAILVSCALVGWFVGKLLRLPNAAMLGPMFASAIVHVMGVTSSVPPQSLVSIAQIFLGASVGAQFIGSDMRMLRATATHGVVLIPLMILICAAMAFLLFALGVVAFPAALLALLPGGAAELSLVALALHVEVAAVVLHQVLRIFLIHMLAAGVFRSVTGRNPVGPSG